MSGGIPQKASAPLVAPILKSNQALGLPRRDDAAARAEAMERRRGGKPSADYLRGKNALLEAEARKWLGARAPISAGTFSVPITTGTWVNIGPGTLDSGTYSPFAQDVNSGRPTAILTHPTDPRILYVASCGGGVWKCTNADLNATGDWTWTSITDSLPAGGAEGSVPVGDLAMDPDDPNRLYLGLGDHLNAGNAIGFWISKDAGATWTKGWTNAPGPDNQTARILPLGGGRILVATSGWVNSGLFLSTDGGLTFNRTGASTPGSSFLANALVAFSPTDLALAGYINQYPDVPLKWMYSSDGGSTWSDSTLDASMTALPMDPYAANLACSRTGDGVGYGVVGVKGTGSLARGVVRTQNKGRSWTFLASDEAFAMNDGGQAAYNPFITVDPGDSSHVFIGANYGSYRSLDGGQHWSRMTSMTYNTGVVYSHADFHVATWAQTGTRTLFVGNDGGLSIFRDPLRAKIPTAGGEAISDVTFVDNRRNKGMVNHMAYTVASTTATNVPGARNFVLTGMQDNSTGMRISAGAEFHLNPSTGDGMGVLMHASDATKALASSYSNWIYYCTNFGTASPTWTRSEGITSPNTLFFTPTLPIPTNPEGVLTTTADVVYTSSDFGQHFSALPMTGVAATFHINRAAASYLSAGTYAISGWSSSDGSLTGYVTQNGGASWTRFGQVSPILGTNLWDIAFSPQDPNVLYASTQTYNLSGSHLFKSTNLGASWVAIDGSTSTSNGFPFGIPVNVVRASQATPNLLYAGTDLGVYASENAGSTWSRLGSGLPYVRVEDLYEAPDGSFLRVATYGRGIWELSQSIQAPAITTQPAPASVKVGERATFTVSAMGSTPMTYQWQVSIDAGGTWAILPGETGRSYQTPVLQLADSGKKYRAQASNGAGVATSDPATLTVSASDSRGDVNGDGRADLLWRNASSGAVYLMPMNGAAVLPGTIIHTEPNPSWRIVATADFDGDGKADILWWNSLTGQVYQMLMNGSTIKAQGLIYTEPDTAWKIAGTGDFDGDVKADILWRNATTGAIYLMPMNGAAPLPGTILHTEPNPAWQIVSIADFDGDGRADLLWWNSSTGQVYQMLMNGSAIMAQGLIYTEPTTAWKIAGTGDFDGDGKADILWRNAITGAVYLMPMNGAAPLPGTVIHTEPRADWQIVAIADFDGDSKADILWWNSSSGAVYQMLMNGIAIRSQGLIYTEPNTAWTIQAGCAR